MTLLAPRAAAALQPRSTAHWQAAPACSRALQPQQQPCSAERRRQRHCRRRRAGAPPPLFAASSDTEDVGARSDTDDAGYSTDNDGMSVEQRLTTVQNMVATADILVPYDRSAVNMGLILWGAIRNIPHKARLQLLSRLNSGDIKRLWKVAGQRYRAPVQQAAATIGPDYSIWHDLPSAPGQLSHFRGKAALPTHALGVSSFSKAFFLHPGTEELYGRVLLGKGPLGDLLYPLYYKAQVGTFVVPTTQEPCDLKIEYLPPGELGLERGDLPRSLWPSPRPHLPPFHEGFTDFVRAVAPGVYVGLGYRTASTEAQDPLYFLMVQKKIERDQH